MNFIPKHYQKLQEYDIILASTSPRRYQILQENLGIQRIKVMPPKFEENLAKDDYTIEGYVKSTSLGKAKAVLQELKAKQSDRKSLIISADTVISCDDKIYEKPISKQKQREMFQKYRDMSRIQVITSIVVAKLDGVQEVIRNEVEITSLIFDSAIEEDVIDAYINSEEGLEVAGGFKFQGYGCLLFSNIEGDYFNVVGLPVRRTFKLLQGFE